MRKVALLITAAAIAAGAIGAPAAIRFAHEHRGTAHRERMTSAASVKLCGWAARPPVRYDHVIWIWLENHNYEQVIGSSGSEAAKKSPFVNGTLRTKCGLATNVRNETHPSLPNYIAATSGGLQGFDHTCVPAECSTSAPNLFSQLARAGKSWGVYADAMPKPCQMTNSGTYAVRHNPPAYYTRLAQTCAGSDVPLGTTHSGALNRALSTGKLPSFSFIVPDLCNSTHNCSRTVGDAFIESWVGRIASSVAWKQGKTAIFVTWDEGEGGSVGADCIALASSPDCHIALLVIAPSVRPGTTSGRFFTHYSLLRTTQAMLGLSSPLGRATPTTTRNMRRWFNV